jgi:hypothetical protein
VGLEDFNHAIEIFGLLRLQLVAAGADRAGRRREPQQRDLFRRLSRQIEQLLFQHPFDAVHGAIDGADFRQLAGRFDDAPQAVIDDGAGAAALGDDHVSSFGHADTPDTSGQAGNPNGIRLSASAKAPTGSGEIAAIPQRFD